MRHINIPIFIPHLGCPNQCIFCNQRYISGTVEFHESDVEETIKSVLLSVLPDDECEIAFFGGSFTGIDRNLMIRLLDTAQKYVNCGKIIGIRMSTRPDYISSEIIDILKNYTITCIELGIQSMNDDVLSYLKRGHIAVDTINAASLLKSSGFSFVGQMMVGLPSASVDDEIKCAEAICALGASGARIYPTIVFKQTDLQKLTYNGEYTPLTLDEAIARSANVLEVFIKNNVPCIRIGLCESENLHSESMFVAGPNHPSLGEMVKSEIYLRLIKNNLTNKETIGKQLVIYVPKGTTSQIIGNKKKNISKLKEIYNFEIVKIIENTNLKTYNVITEIKEE